MKKLIKSAAVMLAMIWCMSQAFPVYASGTPVVILESDGADMKTHTLQVECNMENMNQVTNGKVRVTYDGSRLKLLKNQTGNIVSDSNALCESNDCLTGNKKEGEIVFAFASAKEFPSEGCLANMNFAISDQVVEGNEIKLAVSVENIAGNDGKISAESQNLTVKIKKENQGSNGNNQGNNGNDQENDGNNQGNTSGRPDITGSSQGSSSSISEGGSGNSITSNRAQASGNSSKSSIKSNRENSTADKDSKKSLTSKRASDSKNGEEDTNSKEESQLKVSGDEKVPTSGTKSDVSYRWGIPVAVLLALILLLIVYKKRRNKVMGDNPNSNG